MEYTQMLTQFDACSTPAQVAERLTAVHARVQKNQCAEVYNTCFSCLDLTSLGATDDPTQIETWTSKAASLHVHFPKVPHVASLCVHPQWVETVGVALGNSTLSITSVAGGFPSGQTYLEVKMLEIAMAVENGADEIDVVIGLGQLLHNNNELVGSELESLREEMGEEALLKVIIESGLLPDLATVQRASLVAMAAGADFIKTSTGKNGSGATPQAAIIMCEAIRAYHLSTGRKVGFKAAGGIATLEQAVLYYTIVEEILGPDWLTPSLFRLGASSLANTLLTAIEGHEVTYF